jgi:hypothetical protein
VDRDRDCGLRGSDAAGCTLYLWIDRAVGGNQGIERGIFRFSVLFEGEGASPRFRYLRIDDGEAYGPYY